MASPPKPINRGVTSQKNAAATANPAMPQKFRGSLKASFTYRKSIFDKSIYRTSADAGLFEHVGCSENGLRLTAGFAMRGQSLRRAGLTSCGQQTHLLLVREQLVLQLHVHCLALNFLHLSIDRGCTQL